MPSYIFYPPIIPTIKLVFLRKQTSIHTLVNCFNYPGFSDQLEFYYYKYFPIKRIRHLNNILKLIAVLGELINKHTAVKVYFTNEKQIVDPPEV